MKRQRIALFCSEDLLGEGLEHLLSQLVDVEILGPWSLDKAAITHLQVEHPDLVVIAGGGLGDDPTSSQSAAMLTAQILETYTGMPVVQVMLEDNQVRVYNSHTIPARSADLIEIIRRPQGKEDIHT